MTSTRPYLIRAIYEWLLDNELTPYIVVDATKPHVDVPEKFIKDGRIVFNITPGVVQKLDLGNEVIVFDARFSGVLRHIYLPTAAVMAIYARENGRGMGFEEEEDSDSAPPPSPPKSTKPRKPKKPHLKVVK